MCPQDREIKYLFKNTHVPQKVKNSLIKFSAVKLRLFSNGRNIMIQEIKLQVGNRKEE